MNYTPVTGGVQSAQHPRPSNYGGDGNLRLHTTGNLDWVSVTYRDGFPLIEVVPPAVGHTAFIRKSHGRYGYKHLYQNEYGVSVMTGGDPRQGIHMVLTGDTLQTLRKAGVTDRQLCQHIEANKGNVARLDLALDLHNCRLTVDDLAGAHEGGELDTHAKKATQVRSLGAPDATFYLGSRSSDRFLRAYNKAAQMGVVDMGSWLRLELETKKLRARALTGAVAAHENTRTVVNAAIGDFMSYPKNEELTKALADNDAGLLPVERKVTDTYRWLIDQVAPAMARYQFENPGEDVLAAFTEAYKLALTGFESRAKGGHHG